MSNAPAHSRRFKLTVAYDGTGYSGWQIQKVGLGVQQKVEEALQKVFPSVQRIYGSSRTDTGVHAVGMVVHVDLLKTECRSMPVRKLPLAINAHLPSDIRIMSAQRAAPDFHAQFDAIGKEYRYTLWNHHALNPLLIRRAWHVKRKLNARAMREAAPLFVGRHDFRAFAAAHTYEIEDTVRTLRRCEIKGTGPQFTCILEGDGFLYKMCRGIVGTLVQVGEGKYQPEDVQRMLEGKDRRHSGMNAPAHGLVLWKVFYPKRKKTCQGKGGAGS